MVQLLYRARFQLGFGLPSPRPLLNTPLKSSFPADEPGYLKQLKLVYPRFYVMLGMSFLKVLLWGATIPRAQVTELTSRSMLAAFGHATVRCQKVWDKMQVSQERVSNCFRALGNSIESACAHMETEMGRLVRMQEKATKKQTDLLEK